MTVWVDEIREYPPTVKNHHHKKWSHMWADTDEELQAYAKLLGLRRSWYQDSDIWYLHYDVTPPRRAMAIELGAQFKPAREHAREVLKKKGLLR